MPKDKNGAEYNESSPPAFPVQHVGESFYTDLLHQIMLAYGQAWQRAHEIGDSNRESYYKGVYDGTQECLKHYQEVSRMDSLANATDMDVRL